MIETWKTHPQFTKYEYSNLGRLRRDGRVLKPRRECEFHYTYSIFTVKTRHTAVMLPKPTPSETWETFEDNPRYEISNKLRLRNRKFHIMKPIEQRERFDIYNLDSGDGFYRSYKIRKVPNRPPYSLPGEEWRTIKDYPNYLVSNKGRIFSLRRERFLDPYTYCLTNRSRNDSFNNIALSHHGISTTKKVHYLVYQAFVGPVPTDEDGVRSWCDFKDGDRNNCALDNLQWVPRGIHPSYTKRGKAKPKFQYAEAA